MSESAAGRVAVSDYNMRAASLRASVTVETCVQAAVTDPGDRLDLTCAVGEGPAGGSGRPCLEVQRGCKKHHS